MHLLVDRHIDFCARRPQHHDALTACVRTETADVLAQHLHHLPTGLAVLHVVAVQSLGVVSVESCLHGNDALQFLAYRLNVLTLQHLGIDGTLIGILRIHVPAAKHDVVDRGHRHDVGIA